MTSTAIKEVNSLFANMAAAQTGKSAVGASSFQSVWNGQMSKNAGSAQDNGAKAAGRQGVSAEKLQRGSSLREKESRVMRNDAEDAADLSTVDQEQAMEVLNTAAVKLMQEVADALGITMEELQAAMDGVGMETLDVLDASKLSGLLLNLSGAQDLYALVTDGDLYENYRMLMDQLNGVLQESAEALGVEPEQLQQLLADGLESAETVPEELVQTGRFTEETRGPEQNPEAVEGETAAQTEVQEAVEKGQEAQNRTGSGREERHSEGRSEGEPQFNLLLQNIREGQFQPQAAAQVQGSPWSEATQEIMNQVLDYMKLQLNADTTNLEMQLHPASLGTLQIQLASKAGMVTANFIVQNEAVKAALETQMVQLKEQFEEQGIRVESIEVTVQTHEFERNLDEQGRGRGQQPERKSRTRRIGQAGPVSLEEPEEEEPMADRVAAGGSTVEYTA